MTNNPTLDTLSADILEASVQAEVASMAAHKVSRKFTEYVEQQRLLDQKAKKEAWRGR